MALTCLLQDFFLFLCHPHYSFVRKRSVAAVWEPRAAVNHATHKEPRSEGRDQCPVSGDHGLISRRSCRQAKPPLFSHLGAEKKLERREMTAAMIVRSKDVNKVYGNASLSKRRNGQTIHPTAPLSPPRSVASPPRPAPGRRGPRRACPPPARRARRTSPPPATGRYTGDMGQM